MNDPVRMIHPSRVTPEGGCPHPYELPEHANGSRQILIGGGMLAEQTVEQPAQITVSGLLEACGVSGDGVKALFLGWPAGEFVPCDPERMLELNCETLYFVGANECMVDVLARLAADLRNACCGRCVFGREGTYQMHLIFSDIAAKKGQSTDPERLTELSRVMTTQCCCSFGAAAGRAVLSALALCSEEIQAHLSKKTCPALVCKAYVSYYIDPALCSGCQDCQEACDEEAIEGRKGFIHILDRSMCEKCGDCVKSCRRGAIKAASGAMPRLPVKPVPCGSWK